MTLKITKVGASQPEIVRQADPSQSKTGAAGQAVIAQATATLVTNDAAITNLRKSATAVREIDRVKSPQEAKDLARKLADSLSDTENEAEALSAHSGLDQSSGRSSGFLA